MFSLTILNDMEPSRILEEHGFKRTPLRIRLLEALATEQLPLRAEELQELLPDADPATLYRALEALAEAGVLERSDFQHNHAHYELRIGRPHHHHIVCEGCGRVADVPAQDSPQLAASALKQAKGFTHINRHSLEFYGLCVSCA